MRAVIQRVTSASVETEGHPKSEIGKGLLVLLGIESADTDDDIAWLVKKTCGLRIFDDVNGVMNLSVEDIGGEVLIVSQFTLMASYKKGNRPSYIRALQKPVKTGVFGAYMKVSLLNDGPVTICMDTKNKE